MYINCTTNYSGNKKMSLNDFRISIINGLLPIELAPEIHPKYAKLNHWDYAYLVLTHTIMHCKTFFFVFQYFCIYLAQNKINTFLRETIVFYCLRSASPPIPTNAD